MVRSFYALRASLAGLLSPSLTSLIFTFIQLTLLFVQLGPSLFAFHFSASIYLFSSLSASKFHPGLNPRKKMLN
ncbi:hypothetical protein BC827DRAFT_1186274 [Russula dissimulans]|nr:hypothetical protein BC827DRAFT_1236807 [Russula dissimulans]KAH9964919.1 hypothetical protein BC827DRAFT_1186274 [Russula dissimulans]